MSQVQLHADEDVAEVRSCSDKNGIKLNKQNVWKNKNDTNKRSKNTSGCSKLEKLGPWVHIFWRQLRYRKCWSCWARWRRKVRRLSKSEVHMQQKNGKKSFCSFIFRWVLAIDAHWWILKLFKEKQKEAVQYSAYEQFCKSLGPQRESKRSWFAIAGWHNYSLFYGGRVWVNRNT